MIPKFWHVFDSSQSIGEVAFMVRQ